MINLNQLTYTFDTPFKLWVVTNTYQAKTTLHSSSVSITYVKGESQVMLEGRLSPLYAFGDHTVWVTQQELADLHQEVIDWVADQLERKHRAFLKRIKYTLDILYRLK